MKIEDEFASKWRLKAPGCSPKSSLSPLNPHVRVLSDIFRPLTVYSQELHFPFRLHFYLSFLGVKHYLLLGSNVLVTWGSYDEHMIQQ